MKFEDLMKKLAAIVDAGNGMLLKLYSPYVTIEAPMLSREQIAKITHVLNRYGEAEWWIVPSTTIQEGISFRIEILDL